MNVFERRRKNEALLTQELVHRIFSYNNKTGTLTYKVQTNSRALVGQEVGWLSDGGYRCVRINKKNYKVHRIIWFMVYGYFPEHHIDHRNGKKHDNRLQNLCESTQSCNMQNSKKYASNTTGYVGVSKANTPGVYKAHIGVRGKHVHIGTYRNIKHAAYARFRYELNCPDWNCDGRHSTYKTIKKLWPDFPYKKNGKLKKGRMPVVPIKTGTRKKRKI